MECPVICWLLVWLLQVTVVFEIDGTTALRFICKLAYRRPILTACTCTELNNVGTCKGGWQGRQDSSVGPKGKQEQNPMDIRDLSGVGIDKIPGSRVEYNPFPGGFKIIPGRTLHVEFRTDASSGLIFLLGNMFTGDMASAYVSRGHVTFARRCGTSRAFEVYRGRGRVDDSSWHSLVYYHTSKGGKLSIDGHIPFRQYHLDECSNFTSVFFGGISRAAITGGDQPFHMIGTILEHSEELDESETMIHHRFSGCLRNMRIDMKVPTIQPRYYAVSQCDE